MKKIKKLDTIRAFAAMYVFLAHAFLPILKDSPLSIFFRFGQEAVMLFFLLSGFVIHISYSRNPNIKFREYFVKRFRRIYFPIFCSYFISGIIYYYQNNTLDFSYYQLIGNLLMLQDNELKPGNWFVPLFDNGPLWSLSYEWWFYMLFFIFIKKVNSKKIIHIIAIFSSISWLIFLLKPNHIFLVFSYFIIWWAGFEVSKLYTENKIINFKSTLYINIWLLIFVIISLIPIIIYSDFSLINPGKFPLLNFRHFLSVFFLFNFGVFWYINKLKGFNYFFFLNRIAPISYALYLIHRPILKIEISHLFFFDILFKFSIIIMLSYLIEIILQPIFNKLIKT